MGKNDKENMLEAKDDQKTSWARLEGEASDATRNTMCRKECSIKYGGKAKENGCIMDKAGLWNIKKKT